MFALNRAWQAVGERFTGANAASVIGRPGSASGRGTALEFLGAAARIPYRYWRQVREQWENLQYAHDLAWREAELVRKSSRRSKRRALVLLLKQLNTGQRREFRRYGYFHVTGGSGDRYRIRIDTAANIDVVDVDGNSKYRLCAGPVDVPVYAMMAAQLLYLQDPASERRFLQHAKIHPVYPAVAGILQ